MNVDKNVLNDNEGESIGSVKNYVQSFKDIESNKMSDAPKPVSYQKKETPLLTLPETWGESTEKEILLHYCRRFGCLDFADLEDKRSKITIAVNRTYKLKLSADEIGSKITKLISQEDLFNEESNQKSEASPVIVTRQVKEEKKTISVEIQECNYSYKKGLKPLTEEQLDLCRFINPKDLVFSSDDSGFFLTVLPGKENIFDKIFNFTPKEELLFSMFKEQLGNEHKAKKLVLMSRLMNEFDAPQKETPKKIKKEKPVIKTGKSV